MKLSVLYEQIGRELKEHGDAEIIISTGWHKYRYAYARVVFVDYKRKVPFWHLECCDNDIPGEYSLDDKDDEDTDG